jgi:hypothetical protein
VPIWSAKQHEYSQYSYSFTQPEDPARAVTQLYNLARGHALSMGRNYITMEDVPITTKVVLSTASIERVSLLDVLLAREGEVTLAQAARALPMSKSTILKTMTELAALKLVDLDDEVMIAYNKTNQITLKKEFSWLLKQDFKKIRDGFRPVDASQYFDDEKPQYSKEDIFWERFAELENQTIDGKVPHDMLKESLVASTAFFVDDAEAIIGSMLKNRKLEMVVYGQYRKVNTLTNASTSETDISGGYNNKELAKLLLLHILYENGEGVTVLPPLP